MIENPSITLADLSTKLDELRSDLQAAQRAFDSSIQAWQASLAAEKKDFQDLYQAKQAQWETREKEWLDQRASYELKISQLDNHFRTQLGVTEQNALRALNDLDDSWQRDKLQWNLGT